jgi:hypothetical protein
MVVINALLGGVPGRPKELKTEIENPLRNFPLQQQKQRISRAVRFGRRRSGIWRSLRLRRPKTTRNEMKWWRVSRPNR